MVQPQLCVDQDDAGPVWLDFGTPCTNAADQGCNAGRCVAKTIQVYAGNYTRTVNSMNYPANVANFQMDQYEVTVGEFRRFVEAVVAGWLPGVASGRHTHLNGQKGLMNSGTDGGYEHGWDPDWNMYLSSKRADWDTNLTNTGDGMGTSKFATWTQTAGDYENRPINLVNWYEAYAYCIWDGGFLPSEAEWEWTARGAGNAYKYPWGNNDPADDSALAVYHCYYPTGSNGTCAAVGQKNIADVNGGPAMAGQSFKGHAHMAGNVWEWVLDYHMDSIYPAMCDNCANTDPAPMPVNPAPAQASRVHRGGDFFFYKEDLATDAHRNYPENYRDHYGGLRCARSP
jgi:formylglycine-generating enzyme required for sulfatase activity